MKTSVAPQKTCFVSILHFRRTIKGGSGMNILFLVVLALAAVAVGLRKAGSVTPLVSLCRPPFCLLLALALAFAPAAWAEDWHNLVQPIGTVLSVEPASTVNTRLGGNPPFDLATDVTTVQTSAPLYFVRFYNPTAAQNPSGAVGSWLMRSATVRGLTLAQVRDIFALPSMPTSMTMVLVPNGYNLYTGIAAPISGWGAGGAQQSKLIGPPWVPADNFLNQQIIGDCILCYRLLAPNGNTGRVAAYLDGRIPAAYSDLENVYTSLDLLYYGPLSAQFRDALDQVGPVRYDNLTADALRASLLFNDMTDQRVEAAFSERAQALSRTAGMVALPPERSGQQSNHVWVRAAGGVQRAGDLGFNTQSSGIFAGADTQVSDNSLVGFSAGFISSNLDWTGAGGRAQTDYTKAGVYAAWLPGNWFAQGGINAGASRGDASRRMAFSVLSRTATSEPSGWEGNARVRVGYRLPFAGVDVEPIATLDYFYQRRDAFTENGADSLNLQVQTVKNRTLRSHLGVNVSWDTPMQNGSVMTPVLQLGWAHERPLDDRAITAGLNGQPGDFTVYGDTKTTDSLTAGAGVNLVSGKNFSLLARYGAEYRRDFTDQTLSAGLNYRF